MNRLSEKAQLVFEVSRIPPEGLEIDSPLEAGVLHLEGEDSFSLQPGGRLVGRIDKGEEDSVHVRGRLTAGAGLQCGRCLEPYVLPITQDVDVFALPAQAERKDDDPEDVQLSDRDLVVAYYKGDRLDVGELMREQMLLNLPMKRLCREDCKGLCPTCGANRNTKDCGCPPPQPGDARLVGLASLFDKDRS